MRKFNILVVIISPIGICQDTGSGGIGNMMGVVIVFLAGLSIYFSLGLAMEPIETPIQYGQFCEANKISGHGKGEAEISVLDIQLDLDYSSSLVGDGDFDVNQVHAYSQRAEAVQRRVESINQTQNTSLNLFRNIKLTYSGTTPLVGANHLASAIGGTVDEEFAVNEIERDQTTFVTSTKDENETDNPVHLMGIDTKNSFEGTWGTVSTWYEMFSKDIRR